MKHRICISLDEDTVVKLREGLRKSIFRNKSHLVEHAVNDFLENKLRGVK